MKLFVWVAILASLVSYSAGQEMCYQESLPQFPSPAGFNITDLPELLKLKKTMTKEHRISAVKICATSTNVLTGIQLQIGRPNTTDNRYSDILTLGAIGVVEPCSLKTTFAVPTRNNITSLNIWFNETVGVSEINI